MDVGVFKTLKNDWKKSVVQFRINTNKQEICNENFAPILNNLVQDVISIPMLQNAFRACDLIPFNVSAIDYSKLVTKEVKY